MPDLRSSCTEALLPRLFLFRLMKNVFANLPDIHKMHIICLSNITDWRYVSFKKSSKTINNKSSVQKYQQI